jgi:Uma2 family endonuclease
MPTGTAVSVEEYLRTSYDPDVEYVDGQLVERSVGERQHSRVQAILARVLGLLERERGFEVFTEQRVVIDEHNRYRIPDVCVKALPYEPTSVLSRPDLVIEILSPDDTLKEVSDKCLDYVAAGIPAIWIVDPYRQSVYTYDAAGLHLEQSTVSTELTGPVDFEAIFAELR